MECWKSLVYDEFVTFVSKQFREFSLLHCYAPVVKSKFKYADLIHYDKQPGMELI